MTVRTKLGGLIALGLTMLALAPAASAAVSFANYLPGNWTSSDTELSSPQGVGMDGSDVVVADSTHDQIRIYSPSGALQATYAPDNGFGTGVLQSPTDAALLGSDILVTTGWPDVRKVNASTGANDGEFGTSVSWVDPKGISVSADGKYVAVADATANVNGGTTGAGAVYIFDSSGNLLDTLGGDSTLLKNPEGATFDSSDNLWIADTQEGMVVEFPKESGNVWTAGGGSDWTGQDGGSQAFYPTDVEVDQMTGDVWVADWQSNVVAEFASDGTLIQSETYAANSSDTLGGPLKLALDPSSGDLYAADEFNNRIVRYSAAGNASPTVATTPADAITATTATLHGTVDPNGQNVTDCYFVYQAVSGPQAGNQVQAPCAVTGGGQIGSGQGAVDVEAGVTGLAAATPYEYQLIAANGTGTSTSVGYADFTTLGPPSVQLGAADGLTSNSATLHGTVNPEGSTVTSCYFDYYATSGPDAFNDHQADCSPMPGGGTQPVDISVTVGGLSQGTNYEYELTATSAGGGTTAPLQNFNTLGLPSAGTELPTSTGATELVLSGEVTGTGGLDTHYYFAWGPDLADMTNQAPAYPGTDIGTTPTGAGGATADLTGLEPDTQYCYALVAFNAAGATDAQDAHDTGQSGAGVCVVTSAAFQPGVETEQAATADASSITFAGQVNPSNLPTSYYFQYSTNSDVSFASQTQPVDMAPEDNTTHEVSWQTASGLQPGTQYFFRIVATNADGTSYGNIESDWTWASDAGFRPDPNGFWFCNYTYDAEDHDCKSTGDYAAVLTAADMELMFGPAVCENSTGPCKLTTEANNWRLARNDGMHGGHCYGFSAYSLFVFAHELQSPFESSAPFGDLNPYDVAVNDGAIQNDLAIAWSLQELPAVYTTSVTGTPNQILDDLKLDMNEPGYDTSLSIFGGKDGKEGHNIVPYGVQQFSADDWWVFVYDNNYPGDTSRAIHFNTSSDTWSYDLDSSTHWSGNADKPNIEIADPSIGLGQQPCDFCSPLAFLGLSRDARTAPRTATNELDLTGDPRNHPSLVVTDSAGRRQGFVDGSLVSDIPGGRLVPVIGGISGESEEPTQYLPSADNVTMHIEGNSVTAPTTTDASLIGPGYTVRVSSLRVSSGSGDELGLSGDGTSFSFSVGQGQGTIAPVFEIGREVDGADYDVKISGVELSPRSRVRAVLSPATLQLQLRATGVPAGTRFRVTATRTDRAGHALTQTFGGQLGHSPARVAVGRALPLARYALLVCKRTPAHGRAACRVTLRGTDAMRGRHAIKAWLSRGAALYGVGVATRTRSGIRALIRLGRPLTASEYTLRLAGSRRGQPISIV